MGPPKFTRSSAMAGRPRNPLLSIDYSPGPIVWHYLRDPTFSRCHTIPECDTHTHTHRQRDGQTHDDGICLDHTARPTKYNYQATSVSR